MVFSGVVNRGKEEPDFQTKLFYMYIHHFGPAVIGANCFGVPPVLLWIYVHFFVVSLLLSGEVNKIKEKKKTFHLDDNAP